jgi:hypothetical protein
MVQRGCAMVRGRIRRCCRKFVVSRVRDGGVYAGAEQGCALAWVRGTASAGCMRSVRWGIFSFDPVEAHITERHQVYTSPGTIANTGSVMSTVRLGHTKRCSRQLLNQPPRRNVSTSLASAHEPLGPAASATMSATMSASATCSSLPLSRSSVRSRCPHGFANIYTVSRHVSECTQSGRHVFLFMAKSLSTSRRVVCKTCTDLRPAEFDTCMWLSIPSTGNAH